VVGAIYLQTGGKSLVLVPRIGLLSQTSKDFKEMLDGPTIGVIGNGKRELDADVIVATAQTLQKVLDSPKNRKHAEDIRQLRRMLDTRACILCDEAHRTTKAFTWYKIAKLCPAPYRFAVSGTLLSGKPWEDMRLRGIVGRVVVKVTSKAMWERGNLAKPTVYMVSDRGAYDDGDKVSVSTDYKAVVDACLVNDVRYNKSVIHIARHMLQLGKAPMIFTRFIKHIKHLSRIMGRAGIPHEILYGRHDVAHREEIKRRYMQNADFIMLVSTIFDEGENVNNLPALIMAGGGKGDSAAIKQRIGRGMRVKAGDNRVLVFDFMHQHNRMLNRHAVERKRMYREQGMEVVDVPNIRALSQYSF
jgi:superfamily II DNA or RNA helicase